MNDNLQARGRTSTNAFVPVLLEQPAKSLCTGNSAERTEAPTARLTVANAKVIPPPGRSLQFLSNESDPRLTLFIDPAAEDDYYYVTLVSWGHESEEGFSHAEGPCLPISKEQVWAACQHYDALHLVENGKRSELTPDQLIHTRWLHHNKRSRANG